MFEAGFLEMLLIGVVALLVVGPERLPGIARKTGEWVGKIRRFITNSKQDLERELRTEEMRNMLIMQEEQIRDLRDSIKQGVDDTTKDINKEINDISESVGVGKQQQATTKEKSSTSETQIEAKPTPVEENPSRPPEPKRTMTNEDYHSILQEEAAAKQSTEEQAATTASDKDLTQGSTQTKQTDEALAIISPQEKTSQTSTDSNK